MYNNQSSISNKSQVHLYGQKIIARAWVDERYKQRLLSKGKETVAEIGVDVLAEELVCVENTEKVHNVVVCSLCSCYPEELLGSSPLWYRSITYRSRIIHQPRVFLREFGLQIPNYIQIRVHDSTFERRYFVLPLRPQGAENMNELELAELVTRDSMIGVGLAKKPEESTTESLV